MPANDADEQPNRQPATDAASDDPGSDAPATRDPLDESADPQRVVDAFGADPLTDDQIARLPDHPLLRRGTFYAARDLDRYLDAAAAGATHSIVTGVGPSGPLHLGHVFPLYLAKRLQDATGAHVYVPFSDDEKRFTRGLGFEEIGEYTRDNLRDVLAVGFDPERTRIVVDTLDADVLYPQAADFAADLTQATVEATYGAPDNPGEGFYPAMQATHLVLPQLVHGPHPTLVPIGFDQDPHVRVCRDLAGKERHPVEKPAALLSRFLPSLTGPGKMSSSDDAPSITLTDDPETVADTVRTHAYSGGRESVAAHREHGGDPEVDVAFQYLRAFFEPDDDRIARIERDYRAGELLSGELKELAIDAITDFLRDHQARRAAQGDLAEELAPYRLREAEREGLRPTL